MNTMNTMTAPAGRETSQEAVDKDERMELLIASVDLNHAALLDYLMRLCRNFEDARDISQTLWRYVYVSFPADKIGCYPLLRRKAYQLFVDSYRAAKRRPEIAVEELPEVPVAGLGE